MLWAHANHSMRTCAFRSKAWAFKVRIRARSCSECLRYFCSQVTRELVGAEDWGLKITTRNWGQEVLPSIGEQGIDDKLLFFPSLFLSSSTRSRFYPQRCSGQAVVTGVVPSPPRYVPSFLSRIGFSIPTAQRFSSNFANWRSRAFR